MKSLALNFFSPQENSVTKEKSVTKTVPVTGYISSTGKLVFPAKTVDQLALEPDVTRFQIGSLEGKRKIKSLYLIPASADQPEAFEMVKAAKSYGIPLASILQKSGIDFANTKYTFVVKPFDYDEGVTGYELQLSDQSPKPEYTGKPRGRKPKAKEEAAI